MRPFWMRVGHCNERMYRPRIHHASKRLCCFPLHPLMLILEGGYEWLDSPHIPDLSEGLCRFPSHIPGLVLEGGDQRLDRSCIPYLAEGLCCIPVRIPEGGNQRLYGSRS